MCVVVVVERGGGVNGCARACLRTKAWCSKNRKINRTEYESLVKIFVL